MGASKSKESPYESPLAEWDDETVAVFMVRHGQRIDETQHGKEWRKSAGSRWFDPPLTEEGKEHAIQTATQLQQFLKRHEDDFQPFEKVFCSPLLRTVQTAEQFGAVFNLPVAPSPGIATCTAAFKTRGPEHNQLLPAEEVQKLAPQAKIEHFDPSYGDTEDEGSGCFVNTVASIAHTAILAHRKAARSRQRHEEVTSEASTGCFPALAESNQSKTKTPSVLIVTHREGLRDIGLLTETPFMKTDYCCVAVFSYEKGYGWSTKLAPEDFNEVLQDFSKQ